MITGIHVNQKVVAQFLHLFAVDPPPSGKQSLNLDAWLEAIDFLSWHNRWNVCTRRSIAESRRIRTCIIFRSLGGEPIDDNRPGMSAGPLKWQMFYWQSSQRGFWLLCMNDCFNLWYVDILNKLKHVFMLMQYLDIMDSQRSGICLFGKCLFIHYRICEI